jgi:hypothetical protein
VPWQQKIDTDLRGPLLLMCLGTNRPVTAGRTLAALPARLDGVPEERWLHVLLELGFALYLPIVSTAFTLPQTVCTSAR